MTHRAWSKQKAHLNYRRDSCLLQEDIVSGLDGASFFRLLCTPEIYSLVMSHGRSFSPLLKKKMHSSESHLLNIMLDFHFTTELPIPESSNKIFYSFFKSCMSNDVSLLTEVQRRLKQWGGKYLAVVKGTVSQRSRVAPDKFGCWNLVVIPVWLERYSPSPSFPLNLFPFYMIEAEIPRCCLD